MLRPAPGGGAQSYPERVLSAVAKLFSFDDNGVAGSIFTLLTCNRYCQQVAAPADGVEQKPPLWTFTRIISCQLAKPMSRRTAARHNRQNGIGGTEHAE